MLVGNAAPATFELRAGGVALIPSSSVTPVEPGDWEVISRTYSAGDLAAYVGQPMTIVVGTSRPGEGEPALTGSRGRFDNVSLSYVPEPIAIPVPNGTFHMYKPGTNYTVSATFPEGNIWTTGMGDNAPINGDLDALIALGHGAVKMVDWPNRPNLWVTSQPTVTIRFRPCLSEMRLL